MNAPFNLAAEEYLLEKSHGDVFMLWRNDRSVIIGKNQNPWAEVNLEFVRENSIPVVRRMTGGGAVFHDPGNVNFTFITEPGEGGIDFARFAAPVIRYLARLSLDVEFGGRNDLLVEGRKISGNAQCVRTCADGRKRLIHHGTLLYSARMENMESALRVNREKLATKGITSVRSRVANIRDISPLLESVEVEEFLRTLLTFAEEEYKVLRRTLTSEEKEGIALLSREKYESWEWNFGSSPAFSDERSARFPFGTVSVMFNGENGRFSDFCLRGDFFGEAEELCRRMVGCRIDVTDVRSCLSSAGGAGKYIFGCEDEDLISLIFAGGDGSDEDKGI